MIKEENKKQKKEVPEIEKEELDVLCSAVAATKEPTNRDNFDLFGKYVATKTRKLSQKLDEGVMEVVEDNIITVSCK